MGNKSEFEKLLELQRPGRLGEKTFRARSQRKPFRKRRRSIGSRLLSALPSPVWIVAPLAALSAVYLWDGPPPGLAFPGAHTPTAGDPEVARFARCGGGPRETCVIDGDTFWYRGTKIRILDINTPETGGAECAYERDLGERATDRLVEVLNAGPFALDVEAGNQTDRYGRALRRVTRQGASLGEVLVGEGLAERWQGRRRSWC